MVKSPVISFIMVLLLSGVLHASESRPAFVQYSKANKLFAAARFQDALSLYQSLLLSPPEGVPLFAIRTRIADSWFQLGAFGKALEAYRAAIADQEPSLRPETQYWIGFCCFLQGRDAEAAREFLKIPELYPDAAPWVGTAYYWAGRASERMGKRAEAASYYHKAGGSGRSVQARHARKRAEAVNRER